MKETVEEKEEEEKEEEEKEEAGTHHVYTACPHHSRNAFTTRLTTRHPPLYHSKPK